MLWVPHQGASNEYPQHMFLKGNKKNINTFWLKTAPHLELCDGCPSYRNNPKYWDRQAFTNSVDPDQMPQDAASDQDLHCLSYIQQFLRHLKR